MTDALPLADAPRLRRFAARTRALRLVLVAIAAAAIAAAALSARHPHVASRSYLPAGSTGIVVLDLSASISTDTYSQIGGTLAQLVASGGRYGLVIFSNQAYEALPPGSPASDLEPFERFFRVHQGTGGYASSFPVNPWTESFSEGTSISAGLDLARAIAERDHLPRPQLLLISDLDDDPGDLRRVASSALALHRARIPVHVVALSASSADQQLFARLLGSKTFIENAPPPGTPTTSTRAAIPYALIAAALVAALALAASELLLPPLAFRRQPVA